MRNPVLHLLNVSNENIGGIVLSGIKLACIDTKFTRYQVYNLPLAKSKTENDKGIKGVRCFLTNVLYDLSKYELIIRLGNDQYRIFT